jgi:hypothetical protein
MEKGHFGKYTGNARHSRKEEMIHDRELIFDAKKQLHNADKDYKKDSSSFQMQGDLDKDGKLSGYEANRQEKISEAMSDSPAELHGGIHTTPPPTGRSTRRINLEAETPTSVPKISTGIGSGNKVNANPKTKKPQAFGMITIGDKPASLKGSYGVSEASTGGLGLTGGSGRSNPMTSARTASASTAATDKSKSTSSYTTSGQGRRERRLGKAERKADLKGSQEKVVATRRLEKKASRIKNRAYVKGDKGATNQYDTKK